ncbi:MULTISPECIES: hypothetical protein [Hymenobacter]|uniref:Lipocalin-like domain-containing protein n=1 Tax=Hymenobacter mucosus TaxID=1411120 RepID=A0A238WB60_9BACT|nr:MULTISPECIES: hypothetical protein [Hymenobacter]SNR43780.1 hypothetical protein SAMN06269173_102428 [Hymenobacter mucosus]
MIDLLDVNLQQVPDAYLAGTWRVAERILNRASATTPLAQATTLQLQEGHLQVDTASRAIRGQWSVQRDALLSRPYLHLQLPDEETTALVTRLRRAPDGHLRALTLYFQSGMELQLLQP